jgi:hypothetical protein
VSVSVSEPVSLSMSVGAPAVWLRTLLNGACCTVRCKCVFMWRSEGEATTLLMCLAIRFVSGCEHPDMPVLVRVVLG